MSEDLLDKVDGETYFRCYNCEGKGGFIGKNPSSDITHPGWVYCPVCNGLKVLDWIENARGGCSWQPWTGGSSGPSNSSNNYTGHNHKGSFFDKKEYFQRRKSIYKGV